MLSENAKDIPGYEGFICRNRGWASIFSPRVIKAAHGSTQLRKGGG